MNDKKKHINNKWIVSALIIINVGLLSSCQSPKQVDIEVTSHTPAVVIGTSTIDAIQCKSPRSSMCTKEYRPVCATRDTSIRCVTTPCPSIEKVTKGNACTACADDAVSSYISGSCQ